MYFTETKPVPGASSRILIERKGNVIHVFYKYQATILHHLLKHPSEPNPIPYRNQAPILHHLLKHPFKPNPSPRTPLRLTQAPAPSPLFTPPNNPSRYRPRFSRQVHLCRQVSHCFLSELLKHGNPLTDCCEQVARWQERKRARVHNSQVLGAIDPGFGVYDCVWVAG